MVDLLTAAPAIALLPLASFVIALAFGRMLPLKGAIPGIVATLGSLVLSVGAFLTVADGRVHHEELFVWAGAGESLELTLGVLIDPLSALMLVIVSLIAFLVHVFSVGYMNRDPDHAERGGLPRYYASLGLFSFSMLAFVFASNLLMAFMFFELVGLCSYLLIGFWYRDLAPPSAAKKAFLVTRFGDYFFLIGVVAVFATFGTAAFAGEGSFPQVANDVLTGASGSVETFGFEAETWFTIVGLLILGGVIGKSAQFPLHTWLPDAMEGPTPVSALIHAATMVAAGVYLVARMYGYYAILPTALGVIAFVGAFTALFAATMGVVKDDIKQVLAYSTISQYGYMMLGLGVGGFVAGTFHLMNHAFFKALLFLGAGSVIVMTHHEQDMWKLGGLKERAPVTYWTFVAGSLALAGIIPFSGFWSKDEILYEALVAGFETPVLLLAYLMALVAVFFTGFYTIRMLLLTFHGEARSEHAAEAHPVGWPIKVPLLVLGVLAVASGLVNMVPVAEVTGAHVEYLAEWLDGPIDETAYSTYAALTHETVPHADLTPLLPAVVSLALALAGAGLAYRTYAGTEPQRQVDRYGTLGRLAERNYYLDEVQVWLASGLTARLAGVADLFDQVVIDGLVNAASSVSLFVSGRIKRLQTGVVTSYAAMLLTALLIMLLFFGLYGGWF
ncbi:MAG: NADH-quinone oxidoreductase subunit L [Halobacteriales archaeon]